MINIFDAQSIEAGKLSQKDDIATKPRQNALGIGTRLVEAFAEKRPKNGQPERP